MTPSNDKTPLALREILDRYAEYYHLKVLNRFSDGDMQEQFPDDLSGAEALHAIATLIEDAKPEKRYIRKQNVTLEGIMADQPYAVDQFNGGFNLGIDQSEQNLKERLGL